MSDLSVIIPTANNGRGLPELFSSLSSQNLAADRFEILIVENGPAGAVRDVVSKYAQESPHSRIRYLHEPVPGLLAARHKGVYCAETELLVFADDDIIATSSWLETVLDGFADPRVHLVGGPSRPKFEVPPPVWLMDYAKVASRRIICGPLSLFDLGDKAQDIDPTYVWGLNYGIRKQTLLQVGGFHPDYRPDETIYCMGDGETGLSLKCRHRGLGARYLPMAAVFHRVPRSRLTFGYFEKRFFLQGISDAYTAIRRENGPHALAAPGPQTSHLPSWTPGSVPYDHYRKIIRHRLDRAHKIGYRYLGQMVKKYPILLEWVLREDYFDAKLPDIGVTASVAELLSTNRSSFA